MTAALRILEPSIAATLQDCGRHGYQRYGVPVSGALDAVSLAVANALAGNPSCTAAIEIIGAGLTLEVEAVSATLALAGAAGGFELQSGNGVQRLPSFQTVNARRGSIVKILPPKLGMVSYLAPEGGFGIEPVLGSLSTYTRAALGGYKGRVLLVGDRLPLHRDSSNRAPVSIEADIAPPSVLRVMRGPNSEYFPEAAFETLFASAYKVSPASDRMGLRLQGAGLERAVEGELPPQAATPGSLQVPAGGQPILLLADRQTTGGYPRIATVIGADIAAAGRLGPGMSVRFSEVTRKEAIRLLREQQAWLASLPKALKPAGAHALSPERLLGSNLIGGVTAGLPEE